MRTETILFTRLDAQDISYQIVSMRATCPQGGWSASSPLGVKYLSIYLSLFHAQAINQKPLDLEMDVIKPALVDLARPISSVIVPVVLLNSNHIPIDSRNPSNVSELPSVRLSNRAWHRLVINPHTTRPSSLIPLIPISPRLPLVLVVELDAQALIHAPCHEAGALALEVEPLVRWAAAVLVGIVVDPRTWDFVVLGRFGDVGAFALDVAVLSCLDVFIGNVAAVRDLIPDGISLDVVTLSLAGDSDILAFFVGFLDREGRAWTGAAVEVVAGHGVGVNCSGKECERIGAESCQLHFERYSRNDLDCW